MTNCIESKCMTQSSLVLKLFFCKKWQQSPCQDTSLGSRRTLNDAKLTTKMIIRFTHAHLGPIWDHLESSDVPKPASRQGPFLPLLTAKWL